MQQSLPLSRALRTSLVLAAITVAAVASAAVDSVVHTFDVTTGGNLEITDWFHTLTLPALDAGKGPLIGIDYSLDWKSSLDFDFQSVAGNGGEVDITHDLDLAIYDGGFITQLGSIHLDSRVYKGEVLPNQTLTFDAALNSGTITGSVPTGIVALIPGSTFGLNATSLLTGTGSGQFNQINNTFAGLKGSVTYKYEAVPEPATMAALGFGLLGLARRRKGTK